jgi:hypothetical protein
MPSLWQGVPLDGRPYAAGKWGEDAVKLPDLSQYDEKG